MALVKMTRTTAHADCTAQRGEVVDVSDDVADRLVAHGEAVYHADAEAADRAEVEGTTAADVPPDEPKPRKRKPKA